MDQTKPMRTGSTVAQFAAAISAGLSAMAAGVWLSWPSSANKVLRDPEFLNLTREEISAVVSLMDLGNVLSPIPSGYLMDGIGRKLTLLLSAGVYLISFVLALVGNSVWYLYVARLLAGIGKGIAFAVTPIFLGEIADKRLRGALSTCFIGLLNAGMAYDYVYGAFVSYNVLNFLNLSIPILFIATFWIVPESPYFLLMKGRDGSARHALSMFRWTSKDNAKHNEELENELEITRETVERDMQNRGRFIDVFKGRGNQRALVIIVMLALFQRLSGISPTLAYSTTIMPEHGGGASKEVYMIIFSVLLVAANFCTVPLVDSKGRKPLLLMSSISSAIVMGVAGIYYYLREIGKSEGLDWIPYVMVLLFAITYSLGVGFLPSTLVAELFPTNVRSHAGSISAIFLAATSFAVNLVFLTVAHKFGVYVMYAIFSGSAILCAIFVVFYVIETKGKTFLEIQNVLNNKGRPV